MEHKHQGRQQIFNRQAETQEDRSFQVYGHPSVLYKTHKHSRKKRKEMKNDNENYRWLLPFSHINHDLFELNFIKYSPIQNVINLRHLQKYFPILNIDVLSNVYAEA